MALTCLLPLPGLSPSPCHAAATASFCDADRSTLLRESAKKFLPAVRPSLFFAGGCKGLRAGSGAESRRSGGSRARSSSGAGIKNGVVANYGIKEYGTPQPPYGGGPPLTEPSEKSSIQSGSEIPKFWDYGTPKSLRDYTNPSTSYGAPKNYGIPAYSAQSALRIAAVETEESLTELLEEAIAAEEVKVEESPEPELGGGDGGAGKESGGGGGGGGGGDGGGAKGEGEEPSIKMSTSQILTLVYAALVGVGGLIGYAKSGSTKSLITGGGAALALFLVYTQLPVNPTLASSIGLGISAVLLGIMGSRFKNSGKFMPAGLVSIFSLIMTGGYLHGIMRSAH